MGACLELELTAGCGQVKEEMEAGTARLQHQLQAGFASQQRQLGPAVSTAVGEALRSDAMAGLLSTAVAQPLHDALTAAFAQQLIPKFESAAAALFQQVNRRLSSHEMRCIAALIDRALGADDAPMHHL